MKRLALFLLLASPLAAQTVPQTAWKLISTDSANTGFPATAAFDGSSTTFWHTQFTPSNAPQPHEIQIDLGQAYSLTGFSYLPRQDGQFNGNVTQYVFYVSTDLTQPWTQVAAGNWAADSTQKSVTFSQVNAHYFRFQSLAAYGGPWTNAAELNVSGAPTTPAITLTFGPSTNALTPCTDTVTYDDGSGLFNGQLAPESVMQLEGNAWVNIGTPVIQPNGLIVGVVAVNPNFVDANGFIELQLLVQTIFNIPSMSALLIAPAQLQNGATGLCGAIVMYKANQTLKYETFGLTP